MIKAILFDLDMTLVDSSAVEVFRRHGQWNQVRKAMHRVGPFALKEEIQPHQIPAILRNRGVKVGVVTSSPRDYAEAILQKFKIEYDNIVAYHDTKSHKPDPEPLVLGLNNLGVTATEAVYVGDSHVDFEAAAHAHVKSVGVAWGNPDWIELGPNAPDVMAFDCATVLSVNQYDQLGYLGEVIARGNSPIWHSGSLLRFGEGHFALGRYFTTSDSRHGQSPLTLAILQMKDSDIHAKMFAEAISLAVHSSPDLGAASYLVHVPAKLGQTRDRFKVVLHELLRTLPASIIAVPDGLQCTRAYDKLRAMSPKERRQAVAGAFISPYRWEGKHLILIDDVCTSRATANECSSVLKNSGASKVTLLTLGKDQTTIDQKICPVCGRFMRIRTNRQQGNQFWGCSGYPEDCKHTEKI